MSKIDQELYTATTYELAKVLTKRYSTSFFTATTLFTAKRQRHIQAIYAMARIADEIVDAGFNIDKTSELSKYKKEVNLSLANMFSSNPVLHAFALTVTEYSIPLDLIDSFFESMEMDLVTATHSHSSYTQYVYGSAEVIGLMCLTVFCEKNQDMYNRLQEPARQLGSAFQKINFLRDLQSDTIERGRVYFPDLDMTHFSESKKRELVEECRNELTSGRVALTELPLDVKNAVGLAGAYYDALLTKIQKTPVGILTKKRVRISNWQKMLLYIQRLI